MGDQFIDRERELHEAPSNVELRTGDSASSVPGVDKGAIGKRFEHDALRDKVADLERGTAPGLETPGLPNHNLSEFDVSKGLGNIANPTGRRSVDGLLGGRAPSISDVLGGRRQLGPDLTGTLSYGETPEWGVHVDEDGRAKASLTITKTNEDGSTTSWDFHVDPDTGALHPDSSQTNSPPPLVDAEEEKWALYPSDEEKDGETKDDKKEGENDEGMPNPDEASPGPLSEPAAWQFTPRGGESRTEPPPHLGKAPIDSVNPKWGGESGGGGGVIVGVDGIFDPSPEDAPVTGHVWDRFVSAGGMYTGRPAGPPQGGGPIDPIDPEVAEDPAGSGPLNPDLAGGGTTNPLNRASEGSTGQSPSATPTRSGFRRAAGFIARTAVTVGITIAAVKLGGVMADRNQAPDTPAVSESDPRGSTGTEPVAERAGSTEPFVEGAGAPQAPQTRGGSRPAGRLADGSELSDKTGSGPGAPTKRVPDAGPTRLEEGSSSSNPEQGPTDLERAPQPEDEPEYEPEGASDPETGGLPQY